MFILVIFDKFILIGKLQQIPNKRTIDISKLGRSCTRALSRFSRPLDQESQKQLHIRLDSAMPLHCTSVKEANKWK